MHRRRISKGVIKRVISTLLISLVVIGGCIINSNNKKIDNLEKELYKKVQVEQQATDYTETTIDIKSIETEFNKLCDYKIFEGKVNVKHKYKYNRETFLGFHKTGVLVGTSDAKYQYNVRLADADITVTGGNKLTVTLPTPVLDIENVHMIDNSMYIMEDESKNNMLMSDKDGQQLMKQYRDTFSKRASEDIKDYYNTKEMQDKLNSYAKKEVKNLLNTLGYDKLDVKIKIK